MKKLTTLFLALLCWASSFSQNVGIGTNAPAFKLDVNGRMRVKTQVLNNPSYTPGIWFDDYRDGNNRMFFGMQDSLRIGFYGSGTGGMGWQFNFNAKTGNVGIGRTASSSRLEVDDANGGDIAFYNNGTYAGKISAGTNLEIYGVVGNTNCIPNPCPSGDIILQPAPGLFYLTTGNVGIGVNDPLAKLHVANNVMIGSGAPATGFALSVKGKIVSEELKVLLAANWPDYVFGRDYKLATIDQMKAYIETNGHLSRIPSAAEIEKEGLLVGDMQRRMMEKIEELSLYIIQLNERLRLLEK